MRRISTLITMGLLLAAGTAFAQEEAAPAEAAATEEAPAAEAAPEGEAAEPAAEEAKPEEAAAPKAASSASYGPAGCGLGSMIFEPDSGFTQIFAATTNGTSGNQTFGITTGTSNCDDSSGGEASAKAFVQTNRAALAKDMARGQGETISSLTALAGCSDTAAVGTALQSNFSKVFPTAGVTDEQVSTSVITVLKSNQNLGCQDLV